MSALRDLVDLSRFGAELPLALAALFGVALVALLALGSLVRRAAREAAAVRLDPPDRALGARILDLRAAVPSRAVRRAFRRARGRLDRVASGRSGRYRLPWYLMVGPEGAGKTTALGHAGLELPFGAPQPEPGHTAPDCLWWLFDRGVVLDVAGRLVATADGRASDEPAWRSLLGLVARARSKRPADGVLVALPATALRASAGGADGPDRQTVRHLARTLRHRLAQAQEVLGMRLPVYLVITRCDRVPGFTAFAESRSPAERDQLFGWSNPATADAPYAGAWIDDALAGIRAAVAATRPPAPPPPPPGVPLLRLVGSSVGAVENPAAGAEADAGATPADLWSRLDGGLAELAEPLRITANQIFGESVEAEPFPFRGLYLIGGRRFGEHPDDPDAPAAAAAPHAPAAGEVVGTAPHPGAAPAAVDFVTDLLAYKAFAEWSLARPTARAARRRRLRLRALQAALVAVALAATVGAAWAARRVRQDAAPLERFLDRVALQLDAAATVGAGAPPANRRAVLAGETRDLLQAATGVPDYRLRSVFLPASWWGGGDVTAVVEGALERVALPSVQAELEARVDGYAARGPEPVARRPRATIESLADVPEYLQLNGFVGDLRRLDVDLYRYRRLAAVHGDPDRMLDDFEGLVRSLYQLELRLPGDRAERFWGRVLVPARAPLYEGQERAEALRDQAAAVAQRMYRALFERNRLSRDLDRLAQELARLGQIAGRPAESEAYYRRLARAIERTRASLVEPELQWAAGPGFDLGPAHRWMLAAVRDTRLLGPPAADRIEEIGRRRFGVFRDGLAGYETSYTGPLLVVDDKGEAKLELAQRVVDLQRALTDLVGQPFMGAAPRPPLATAVGPGTYMAWDTARLERAAAFDAAFQEFVAGGLAAFPATLQPAVRQAALANLGDNMLREVALAQSFPPLPSAFTDRLREQAIRRRVDELVGAAPLLGPRILDRFRTLGLDAAAHRLGAAVEAEKDSILRPLDDLLAELDLYTPRGGGFGWWDGGPVVAFEAFAVPDAGGLATYLGGQRAIVQRLATNIAEPALTAVATTDVSGLESNPWFGRWRLIVSDLGDYAADTPGNALGELEGFISGTMAEVEVDGCLAAVAPQGACWAAPTPAGLRGGPCDPLVGIRQRLAEQLRGRCLVLVDRHGAAAWRELRREFALRLEGRLPFAALPALPPPPEVSPAGLRAYFAVYDRHRSLLGQVPAGSPSFGDALPRVRGFLTEMDAVRSFFAPFLADRKPGAVPSWNVAVDFRVDRGAERGTDPERGGRPLADEIIGWELTLGDKTVARDDPDRTATWSPGQDAVLILRWADDSPSVPVGPLADPAAAVTGRTVGYGYRNLWSLLSLVAAHPAANAPGPPETLRLDVPTQQAAPAEAVEPRAGGPPAAVVATTFVRVAFSALDEAETPVEVPRFPTAAPLLPPGGPAAAATPAAGGG